MPTRSRKPSAETQSQLDEIHQELYGDLLDAGLVLETSETVTLTFSREQAVALYHVVDFVAGHPFVRKSIQPLLHAILRLLRAAHVATIPQIFTVDPLTNYQGARHAPLSEALAETSVETPAETRSETEDNILDLL